MKDLVLLRARFSPRRPASESVKPRVMPRCNQSSSYSIDEEVLAFHKFRCTVFLRNVQCERRVGSFNMQEKMTMYGC